MKGRLRTLRCKRAKQLLFAFGRARQPVSRPCAAGRERDGVGDVPIF
jgi:hypothetical protein